MISRHSLSGTNPSSSRRLKSYSTTPSLPVQSFPRQGIREWNDPGIVLPHGLVATLPPLQPEISLEQELSEQELFSPAAPPEEKPAMVEMMGVTKLFSNGVCVLDGVDLTIPQGEFIFITGVSGAGKSTLLRLLYGAEQPSAGKIFVNDVCLSRIRSRPLALLRRQLGVVYQDYRLLANRTVSENVAFVLRAQGKSPGEIRRRLGPTLKMVGLTEKSERFPHELSGGEQQRLSLARAIVSTPVLLLADEPTGNLDRENSLLVLQILERLNSFGVTVIMTTHDPFLLEQGHHRVICVDSGRLHTLR